MGTLAKIALQEIGLHPWPQLRGACGSAEHVADALRELLEAADPVEAERAYWKLENHVVVQGQLYQAAESVVPVLLATLVDPCPRHVRISVMELLYQIVAAEPHESEVKKGNAALGEVCRELATQGKWLLYRELIHGESSSACDVLEMIEERPDRISALRLA